VNPEAPVRQSPMIAAAEQQPPEGPSKRYYKKGGRATRADFIDESPNEGSLWAPQGQTNYFFVKNKVRSPGDILQITVEADLVRDVGLEVKRSLNAKEKQAELKIAQEKIRAKTMEAFRVKSAATTAKAEAAAKDKAAKASRSPAQALVTVEEEEEEPTIPQATMNDVDISGVVEIKEKDIIMAEIVERFPNGNYKIRGTKRVIYKNGSPRLVSVLGVARAADISEDDVINSGKLYEYEIEAAQ